MEKYTNGLTPTQKGAIMSNTKFFYIIRRYTMSLQLAKNETVVRKFDYATCGYRKKSDSYAVARSLIVTNKRVIHQDVNEKFGRHMIARTEMPIDHAKFVDVRFAKTSKCSHLVRMFVMLILAAGAYLLEMFKSSLPKVGNVQLGEVIPNFVTYGLVGLFGLLAIISLICYFSSRRLYLSCTVSTDSMVNPVLVNKIKEEITLFDMRKKKKKNTLRVELSIRVNRRAAQELADGLGAAILDAIEMNAEQKQGMEAPAVCCTEDVAAECDNEPVAEEEAQTAEETSVVEETVTEETVAEETDVDATEDTDVVESDDATTEEEPVESKEN